MAVTHRIDAQEVADFLSDALGSDPVVESVYLQVDDRIRIWVIAKPVSIAEERHLFTTASELLRRYASAMPVDFDVVSPRHFPDDVDFVTDVVPQSAKPLELHLST
jgi:hypothetical protein